LSGLTKALQTSTMQDDMQAPFDSDRIAKITMDFQLTVGPAQNF
jgi:hypothetical protein